MKGSEEVVQSPAVMGPAMVQVFAIGACVLWASAFMGGKYALTYLDPLHLAGIRLLLAAAMQAFLLRRGFLRSVRGYGKWILLVSFFQTMLVFSLFNFGLSLVPGSLGAIVIGSSPAVSSFVAVLACKDEHMTGRKALGLSVGLLGIVILAISREPWTGGGRQELLGVCLLMGCNIFSALGDVIVKKRLSALPPLSVNFLQTLVGGVVVTVVAVIAEPMRPVAVTSSLVGSVLFLAIITAVAVPAWMTIIMHPRVRISSITVWKFLIPSLGAVFSWLFIPDDEPSLLMIAVILMIVVAVLIVVAEPRGAHELPRRR